MHRVTSIKAKDLQPGMVVRVPAHPVRHHEAARSELVIEAVERAADAVKSRQVAVAKAKSRPKLRAAVDDLVDVLDAIEYEGREARLVYFVGEMRPRHYASSDELQYLRQATATERQS